MSHGDEKTTQLKPTFDSGTNAATYEPGRLESWAAATPGILRRDTNPLEKSAGSKNCNSFVTSRHATTSSELNRIDGLKSTYTLSLRGPGYRYNNYRYFGKEHINIHININSLYLGYEPIQVKANQNSVFFKECININILSTYGYTGYRSNILT